MWYVFKEALIGGVLICGMIYLLACVIVFIDYLFNELK